MRSRLQGQPDARMVAGARYRARREGRPRSEDTASGGVGRLRKRGWSSSARGLQLSGATRLPTPPTLSQRRSFCRSGGRGRLSRRLPPRPPPRPSRRERSYGNGGPKDARPAHFRGPWGREVSCHGVRGAPGTGFSDGAIRFSRFLGIFFFLYEAPSLKHNSEVDL